jgi:hypothetical protein
MVDDDGIEENGDQVWQRAVVLAFADGVGSYRLGVMERRLQRMLPAQGEAETRQPLGS